jgi:hypothetical protein
MYKTQIFLKLWKMKKTINSVTAACMALLLISGFLTGCTSGPNNAASKPPRKTLLTPASLQENGGWDGFSLASTGNQMPSAPQYAPMPFTMADTVLTLGGSSAAFYVVRIPSGNFDFLLPMAKVYEPYLSAMLGNWSKTGRQGVAIDLSAGNATQRSAFQLESADHHVSLPIVLLYDQGSAGRVDNLIKTIKTLSIVQCEELENGTKISF